MKKAGLCALILVFILPIRPQAKTKYAIDQGSIIVNGSAGISFSITLNSGSSDGEKTWSYGISLSPNLLYFVAPKLALGGKLATRYTYDPEAELATHLQIGIGPSMAYFFGNEKSKIYPFIGSNIFLAQHIFYTGNRGSMSRYHSPLSMEIYFSAGLAFMIAKNIAVTGEVYGQLDNAGGSHSNKTGVSLGIGKFVF